MTDPELKPCPWCQRTPVIQRHPRADCELHWIDHNDERCAFVVVTQGYRPLDEVVAAWNTRAGDDEWRACAEKAEAELAELRKASDIVSKSQARRIVASADDNSPGADSHDDTDVRKELDEATVERVARVMHREIEEEDWQGWEDLDAMQKSELRQMARAAISAMRGGNGAP